LPDWTRTVEESEIQNPKSDRGNPRITRIDANFNPYSRKFAQISGSKSKIQNPKSKILPFWQATDEPDRPGMAEVGFVEGLYAMWDELRARHPHLAIDHCASGGRRIDLETVRRSYAL
jgi:alpha-galactosidase